VTIRTASLVVLVVLALPSTACSRWDPSPDTAVVRLHGAQGVVSVQAVVAATDTARERGLAEVRRLAPDAGMAFLFARPSRPVFWMKGAFIPLSIAFWRRDGRIVGLRAMPTCHADPCPTYRAPSAVVGALEVNRGFFGRHGIGIGGHVELRRS
jgi:uncharacterized membrane protein (UPF0127 family)